MTTFREHKRAARRVLHGNMQVAALYIAALPIESDVDVFDVNVRIWTQSKPLGNPEGGNYHGADREEEIPRIIFMLDQFVNRPLPVARAVVSVVVGEAYKIDRLEPKDDISVTAFVTRMKAADTVDLPVPEVV